MREILRKATTFTKIEFWVITTIFAFVVFFFLSNGLNGDTPPYEPAHNYPAFKEAQMPFHFFRNYFFPKLARHIGLYASLVALNFIIIPGVLKRKTLFRHLMLLLLVFGALMLLYGITHTWLYAYGFATGGKDWMYKEALRSGIEHAWITVWVLTIYTAIKYAGIYLLAISETIEARYKIRKEAIVATVVWLVGLLFLQFGEAE